MHGHVLSLHCQQSPLLTRAGLEAEEEMPFLQDLPAALLLPFLSPESLFGPKHY